MWVHFFFLRIYKISLHFNELKNLFRVSLRPEDAAAGWSQVKNKKHLAPPSTFCSGSQQCSWKCLPRARAWQGSARGGCKAIPYTHINVPKFPAYVGWGKSRQAVSKVIPAFCWLFLFPSGLVFCCVGELNCPD